MSTETRASGDPASAGDGATAAATVAARGAALGAAEARFCADWLQGASAAPEFAALFRSLIAGLSRDPERMQALQQRHYAERLALWRHFAAPGLAGPELPEPDPDPRFRAREWREIAWFDYLRRSYGLTTRWLRDLIALADVDASTRRRLEFYAQQFADAASPSNFAATNPEALQLAFATSGESLARGLANLLQDAAKGRVSMSDESAFEVGRNVAVTPGAVVYRNELIELLQYRPLTAQVHRRALLIVPPCINKYYILDLRPENSFVRYAVENGLTVFMLSWRDVAASCAHLAWDDYIQDGVVRAIAVVRSISGEARLNALGFCVGGTLLAAALAVLRRKRRRPAASLTLLASLLDFADPGDIGVYIDEAYVCARERELGTGGIFPGSRLASAFASLRANDLVWRYVVDNYLKGRTPAPFDLLYWNSDSANLPGPMYAYYLRHMYLENALRSPNALSMCGVPVDLGRIDLPTYVLAAEADHIVPWRSAYASARLLGDEVTFVLGGSGHIAGVVNPPQPPRRNYRTGAFGADDPERWLSASQAHPGSWWPHWAAWVKARSGALAAAPRQPGNARHAEIEAAPGRYVRASAERTASA
ncbi:MAG: class I poly(R)-hydroxyalkanoic acid synthase [Betaproteobacteria bacterium]|nr:class I poly(R)-hydroxyalkanoic acid synthase [Betaproteobacteria bacterium]